MRKGYVSLKSDWGFKHLMGQERQMMSFLNSLLSEDYGEIKSLTFENVEVLSDKPNGRGVIFDLLCTTDSGDKIIVEMQNYSHLFFKTRANYYLYSLLAKCIHRGDQWTKMKHDIPHLIGIFFLTDNPDGETEFIIETEEFNRKKRVPFWDRMRRYFIILENFNLPQIEQPSAKDYWIEVIKNLGEDMYKISESVYEKADPALLELIERAQLCNLTDEELVRYEAELKALEDTVDFDELLDEAIANMEAAQIEAEAAKAKAEEAEARAEEAEARAEEVKARAEEVEARAEEVEAKMKAVERNLAESKKQTQLETAQRMLADNLSIDLIVKFTGLSMEEIEDLK